MKRLRNIAIYYIAFGALSALSFVFFDFIWVGVIGLLLLLFYYLAKYVFKINTLAPNLSPLMRGVLSTFFILLPILSLAGLEFYYHRPFKQKIIVAPDYEGVVVIGYGYNNPENTKWDGSYRLIKADKNGLAKSGFKIPKFIGSTLDGTVIYYANNLNKPIPVLSSEPANNDTTATKAYIVDFTDEYQVYILTKNYKKFLIPDTYNKPDSTTAIKISSTLDNLSKF